MKTIQFKYKTQIVEKVMDINNWGSWYTTYYGLITKTNKYDYIETIKNNIKQGLKNV